MINMKGHRLLDFSSEIRLVNEGDQIDRELRIWMNNPLRYAKRTFYQSSIFQW